MTRSRHTVPTTTLSVSSARLRVIRALRRALIRLARPTLDSAAHSPPAPSCPTTARTTSCSPRARPPATPVAPRMGNDSPLVRVAAAQARPHLPHRPHAQVIWRVASPRLALCDVLRARPDPRTVKWTQEGDADVSDVDGKPRLPTGHPTGVAGAGHTLTLCPHDLPCSSPYSTGLRLVKRCPRANARWPNEWCGCMLHADDLTYVTSLPGSAFRNSDPVRSHFSLLSWNS